MTTKWSPASGWTPRLALSTFVMVLLMEATSLGFIVVSTPLPQITRHFQTTQGGWLITGYVLAGAILCPLAGKLADIHGKRRVMVSLLLVSLVGAVVSTTAPTFAVLVIGRFLQGAVIATMFLSYSLMRDVYPLRILPFATSISMTGIGIFSIGTPFLIGWMLDVFGWRALFAFDVVWLAVLTPLLVLTTPESPVRNRSRVDLVGGALLALGLGLLLVGVSLGGTWGWRSGPTVGAICVGVVLLAGFVVRSLTYSAPIVDLRIFTTRGVLFAAITAAATYGTTGLYSAMVPIIVQTPREVGGDYGLGFTALQLGLVTAPQALMMVLGGIAVGKLINRVGAALLMYVGLGSLIVAALLLGFNNGTYTALLVAGLLQGLGTGLSYGAVPALVISATNPENQASIASMVQVVYSGFSSIPPVVLFMVLGSYATFAADGFVVYSADAFQAGALLTAGIVAVPLLLALTVLRRRRAESMILADPPAAASAGAQPEEVDAPATG